MMMRQDAQWQGHSPHCIRSQLMRPAAILCLLVLNPFAAAQKPLAIDDIYRFDSFTAGSLAPDGQRAVVARQWIDAKTKLDRSGLWLIEGEAGKRHPLEEHESDGRAPV